MNAQNGIHSDWTTMDQWKSSSADRKSWFRQWEEMVPPTRRDGSADEKTWFCWWEDSLSEDVAALQWCMIRWIKMWTMKWLLSRRWMWRRGYRRRPVAEVKCADSALLILEVVLQVLVNLWTTHFGLKVFTLQAGRHLSLEIKSLKITKAWISTCSNHLKWGLTFQKYKEQMVARSIRGLTCKNKGWISRNKDRFSVHRTYIGFTMQSVQLSLLYLARMMRPLTTEQTWWGKPITTQVRSSFNSIHP